jgi:hypothetical protein
MMFLIFPMVILGTQPMALSGRIHSLARMAKQMWLFYVMSIAGEPNTALEPTADPRFGLSGSAGFAMRQFGGGSAFVR